MFVKAIIEKLDYYPFGMEMPERTNFTQDWRFGYQSLFRFIGRLFAERDGLTGKNDFMLRQYDSRLARWKTKDPMGQYASPYMAMGNNPVSFIDPNGGYDYLEESEKRNQDFFERSQKDFWGDHIPGAMAAYSADNTAIDMDAMGVEAMKNYYNIMYGVSENNSWAVIGEIDPSFQNWDGTDGTNNSTSSFDLTFIGLDWIGDLKSENANNGQGGNFDNSSLALDIGGGIYGGLRTAVTPGDQWFGKNGKYYNNSWGGNRYTGSRSGAFAASNTYKWAGRATVGATAIIGGIQVYNGYQMDGGQFGYNANLAGAGATGAIVGGWAGAKAGASIGFAVGVWFAGVGAVPGTIIGGFVGGLVGGFTGSYVGESSVNYYYDR